VSARFASENIRDTEKFVHLSCQEEVLVSIDTTLQKLWSVEDLPAKAKVHTPEQQLCEQDFERRVRRDCHNYNSARTATRTPHIFSGKHSEFINFVCRFETFADKDDKLHDIEKCNH